MSLYTADHSQSSIWNMKYRPQTIDECILPKHIKNQFAGMLESGRIPHLLLASPIPGSGKSTSALALCKQLGYDVLFMNASLDNSIDDVRNTIMGFCSSVSLDGNLKAVLLDESDFMSVNAQSSLRGIFEQFPNVSFILTCNYAQKLIEPIRSRCAMVEFKIPEEERKDILRQVVTRVFKILDAEGVTYDKRVVVEFVSKYFPDFRKVLNELQRYAASGTIDAGIFTTIADTKVDGLLSALKDKNFSDARKWIGENSSIDYSTFYGKLYPLLYDALNSSSIPPVILILAKYQHMSSTVVDKELNFAACVLEIMSESDWK